MLVYWLNRLGRGNTYVVMNYDFWWRHHFFFFCVKLNFGWLLTIYVLVWKKYIKIFFLLFQTRPEGCLYLERARDNYQNYDFESRLTVRIHSALRYYTLLTQGKWLLYCVMCFQISRLFLIKFDKTFSIICSIFLISISCRLYRYILRAFIYWALPTHSTYFSCIVCWKAWNAGSIGISNKIPMENRREMV